MITGHDIVCLSSMDWNDVWTRKQRFMQHLARQGNRVLYVETQASFASLGLLRRDVRRAFRWLEGPREVERGLWVGTLPLAIPGFQMSLTVNRANNLRMRFALRRFIRRLGLEHPLLWTYNPYSDGLLGTLGESRVIYECVDELSASRGLVRPEVVRELERRVLQRADLVIVTHESLYQSKKTLAREIRVVPNGADLAHFARAAQPSTPSAPELSAFARPIVGFMGTLQYWIDFDLLRYLATERPYWSFVLVGPEGRLAELGKVRSLGNVYRLGRKPYDAMPGFLKGFDVCLNPYLPGETAQNCSPLKLYEYLAAGRPVVSVDMPEARKFADVIGIGRSYSEILTRLEDAMRPAATSVESIAARMRAVSEHSWGHRFREVENALSTLLDRPDQASVSNTLCVPSAAARHE